jgi:type IV secretory pathway TrbD component
VRGQGWLRKDATADEIREAIDRALTPAAPRRSAVILAGALVLVVIVVAIAWYVLGLRG